MKELEDFKKEKANNEKEVKSWQTDSNPDVPYEITCPLPPIFSSKLCHPTRRIFLSNSLPNISTIEWVKPDDSFQDEAEEALCEQYDRQVAEFYLEEREAAVQKPKLGN